MTDQPRFVRVFLSSPGDVADERGIARKVIEEVAGQAPFRDQLMVRTVAWDNLSSRTPMIVTLTPQEAINRRLSKPSECDIVVVLFWSRMGTQLPHPEYQKPNSDPYYSGTEWEYIDAVRGAREHPHGLPLVVVYRRTEDLMLSVNDPEFDEKRQQYQRVEEFFKQFTRPDGSIGGGVNLYATPDEFRRLFEIDIRELLDTVLKAPETVERQPERPVDVTTEEAWHGSPFPGLRAFTPDDAPIFFGRGRETDELIRKVSESRFVAVVGASGSGKSSLVAAGLLPRLKERAIEGSQDWLMPHLQGEQVRDWTGLRFTPGEVSDNLFVSLAVKLAPMVGQSAREVAEALASAPEWLAQWCEDILTGQPEWAEVLLFIDQFEELFTLVRDDALRRKFVAMLAAIAQAERVRTVVTLRADFYHRCVEYEALAELLRTGSFPLAAPGERALYDMITRPAKRAGLTYEDADLPERILTDTGQEPGTLALLAYTLDELYQDCCDSGDGVLSGAAYEALGGVQGAIGERAESVFTRLDPAAQAMLPRVFRDLVEVDERGTATRQRAPLAHFENNDAAWTLLEKFTEARLLTASGTGDEAVVEVAHEALFRYWDRLAEWIEDTQNDLILRRQVQQAIRVWEQNRKSEDFLWTGKQLKNAQAMAERLGLRLSDTEREFLRSEVGRLEEKLKGPELDHAARARVGEQLHNIGDTRPGVGLRDDGLPDIVWCEVPGGEIVLEGGAGTFTVKPFYIAKYPITSLQFQAFLDDPEGFENDAWWEGLTERYQKQGMEAQAYRFNNHPRDSVSWYQAVAFCRWLTANLPLDGWPQGAIPVGDDWEIRLAPEWEWQQSATGGNPTNDYPWGGEWDSQRANTKEAGLSRTTAVGMYPLGASLVGALDMSGNVWEWCLNEYHNPKNTGLGNEEMRVLRGGAFNNALSHARCGPRSYYNPRSIERSYGLRVSCGASPI